MFHPCFSARRAGALFGCTLVLAATATATATAEGATRQRLTERRLRALEERTLGATHAAEHARQRALRRSSRRPRRAARARVAAAEPPSQVGEWSREDRFPLPIVGTHAVMLATGKVLFFAPPVAFSSPLTHAYLWDPATGAARPVHPPVDPRTGEPVNIFGAGQSLLADGRVLIAGGTYGDYYRENANGSYSGLKDAYTFDPWTERWTRQPDMRHARWYPSQVLLPDGRTAVVSGEHQAAIPDDYEIFTPSADPQGGGSFALGGRALTWSSYPHLLWMPSGRLLVAGTFPANTYLLDVLGSDHADLVDPDVVRLWGTATLLPGDADGPGRVMLAGGADHTRQHAPYGAPASASVRTFDERAPTRGWTTAVGDLRIGRQSHNTVILPDGGLVTVGGGSHAHSVAIDAGPGDRRQVELLDPGATTWRLGAAQAEVRAYHSTALLLPDGRVLSAGDDFNDGVDADADPDNERDTIELYSPPYLFRGPRPAIASAPAAVRYGDSFGVASPDDVRRAVLVAPASVTHATNPAQRHVELDLVRRVPGKGVDVKAPARADLAPPGYYMLFVLDAAGVPSVAKFVRIGMDPADAPELEPPMPDPGPEQPREPDVPVPDPGLPDISSPPVPGPPSVDRAPHPPAPWPPVRPPSASSVAVRIDRPASTPRPLTALAGTVGAVPRGSRIEVGLAREVSRGRCRWWSFTLRRLSRSTGGCARPAHVARAATVSGRWRMRLSGGASRRLRHVVVVRVVGADGATLGTARATVPAYGRRG